MGFASDGPGTLTINLRTQAFNDDELAMLRSLTNEVASDPLSVEHCCVELESAEYQRRRMVFQTTDPVRLWERIRWYLYSNLTIGERMVVASDVHWRGTASWDTLLIHRADATTLVSNPFAARVECSKCGFCYCRSGLFPHCPCCKN